MRLDGAELEVCPCDRMLAPLATDPNQYLVTHRAVGHAMCFLFLRNVVPLAAKVEGAAVVAKEDHRAEESQSTSSVVAVAANAAVQW